MLNDINKMLNLFNKIIIIGQLLIAKMCGIRIAIITLDNSDMCRSQPESSLFLESILLYTY